MWVTFGHLRPSGHIMPDHGGDRGAALLVLAPHDRLHIKQNRMRRRGRWGWPAPGGVASLRKVDGRYLRGSAQVDCGHEACWQIAAWMARHVGGAHKLPAVSLRFPLRGSRVCQRTVADRADRSCRAGPGLAGESLAGCERWPCGSDFQGGTVSGACPAGSTGIGCGRPVAQWHAWPGPGRRWDGEMQLDSAGRDGT
jgi:hypothetical protein